MSPHEPTEAPLRPPVIPPPPIATPRGEVIDLREEPAPLSEPAAVGDGVEPIGHGDAGVGAGLRRRRRTVLWVLVGLVVAGLVAVVGGQVAYDIRQQHRVDDFLLPDEDVTVGEPFALIQIPDLAVNVVAVEGADAAQLRGGPGHVVGTASPGQEGDIVLLGHRSRYGGPFELLDQLPEEALIAVQTRTGLVREYRVSSVETGRPEDLDVLEPGGEERLVLVTHDGGPTSDARVVVTAAPVGESPLDESERTAPTERVEDAALDRRPLGAVGSLVAVALLVASAVAIGVAARVVRRQYGPLASAAVLVPTTAVVVVGALFALDLVLPTTW